MAKTVSVQEPWKPATPHIKNVMTAAEKAFANTPKAPYKGEYFANPNKTQLGAVADTIKVSSKLDDGAPKLAGYANDLLSGKYLDPDSNPWIKEAVDASMTQSTRNFNRNILPNMRSSAIGQGAYGGSREGVMTAVEAAETRRNQADTAANIYATNYENERGRMAQAPSLYGAANDLYLAAPAAKAAAGEQAQRWQQDTINEGLAKYEAAQDAPWNGITNYADAIRGVTGGTGSSTSQTKIPWWQQALQGVGSAIGLAKSF
jgi:hypothetical protein